MNLQEFISKCKQVRDDASPGHWHRGGYIAIEDMPIPEYKLTVYTNEGAWPPEKWTRGIDVYHGGDGAFIAFSANNWNTLLKIIELQSEALECIKTGRGAEYYGCSSVSDTPEIARQTQSEIQKLLEAIK